MTDNPYIPFEDWLKTLKFKPTRFQDMFLGEWKFDAAYTREQVDAMIRRGEISEARGEELLRYRMGVDVAYGKDYTRHTLVARDGTKAPCGGPGICKWCKREQENDRDTSV